MTDQYQLLCHSAVLLSVQLVKPATMKHAFSSQDLQGALSRRHQNITVDKLND